MLFIPTIAGPMSGSLGAVTASHNKGGQYFRLRSTPTNPNTVFQQAVRTIMADLANRWTNVLTLTQRDGWNVYAANVPRPNRFGGTQFLSGIAHYVRSNLPRVQADPDAVALAIVDDAPTTFNVGSFTLPQIFVTTPYATGALAFINTDEWANTDGGALLTAGSRPFSAAKNFFKGPFRSATRVDGLTAGPPSSPATITLPFTAVPDQSMRLRVVATQADGRLSDAAIVTVQIV